MQLIRAPLLQALVILTVLLMASAGYCVEFQQVDVGLAKKTASALAITEKGLPAIATVVIVFYILQSFLFRLLSDLQFHKWAAAVVLNILLYSLFFGGSVSSAIGNVRKGSSTNAQISRVVTDTYPGSGAQESATPASSGTHFEVLASMFDNSDESLASATGDNLAMVQTATAVEHTRWALDMSSTITTAASNATQSSAVAWVSDLFASSTGPNGAPESTTSKSTAPQKELYAKITEINNDDKGTNLLSSSLIYLSNAVSSVAGDVGAMYDAKQMERAAEGEEATGGAAQNASNASNSDDLFAEANISKASLSSSPVTVVTMATYPGGVTEYGRHALSVISNPDKNYHAGTVPAEQIISSLNASGRAPGNMSMNAIKNLPSPTAQGPGTLFDNAKALGFDGDAEGVYPQYFLRAHGNLQSSECGGNASSSGIRPGSNSGSGMGILNPMSNIPTMPIAANTTALEGAAGNFNFLDIFGGGTGNLMSSLTNMLKSTDQMYSKLDGYTPTFSSSTGNLGTVSGISSQYDQLISDSSHNGMSHATNCLKTGKAMLSVASAVSQTSGVNDKLYHNFLESDSSTSASMAEATSTLAWGFGKDTASPDIFAAKMDNEASVADIVRHVVGYVSAIGTSGGSGSMNTKVPTTQETSWKRPDQKLEALINEGQAQAASASQPNADGSKKGMMERAGAAVAGTLKELFATYYQFLLRLLVVLLAGMPFIALLTTSNLAVAVSTISYSIGMAILPIWACMNTGKLFSNASAGDESYNGVSIFPIVTIIITTAVLGAEVAAAKVCQGETMFYLTNIVNIFSAQVEALGYALGIIFTNGSNGPAFSFQQVLTPMTEAVKPFGICAAATIAPMLIGRILMPGVIAPHGSASLVQGMASSAHEGGAAHAGGKIKAAAGAAVGAAVAGPAGAKVGADAAK